MFISIGGHRVFLMKIAYTVLVVGLVANAARGQTEENAIADVTRAGGLVTKTQDGRVTHVSLLLSADSKVERIDFKAFSGLKSISIIGKKMTDRTLFHLNVTSPDLDRIEIISAQITDDALANFLRKQKQLQQIVLNRVQLSNKSISQLGRLRKLKYLNLNETKITDAGLKELLSLRGLQTLCLANTSISDAGMKQIQKMASVKYLFLNGTSVTDAGIQQLAKLENLQILGVGSTKVTENGKAAIQRALPKIEFYDKRDNSKK